MPCGFARLAAIGEEDNLATMGGCLRGDLDLSILEVWSELEKENKEFFEAYSQSQSKVDWMSETETSEMIQRMISDSSKDSPDN
ncbi:plant protein 1589 of unknown function [Actinidia rufa]|uniref:Uncharacterized protein n=1 Tax=Actinidia rufa TaxID=165716 RepID=A0A7J0DFX0_9ERIC|nr:plant protein 1589 of unknown function [Actinidia rufa]